MHSSEIAKYLSFNNRQLSRIYPKGSRVDSSNYDPTLYWSAGCQVVALNYQTAATPMYMNEGMFTQNGGCGYVLKPKMMLAGWPKWMKVLQKVWVYSIRVIDAWRPVSKKNLLAIDAIGLPSLSVHVGVHGPGGNVSKATAVVKNNGLNPVWDETFIFEVSGPEVTCLLFTVINEKSKDNFVGYYSVCLGASRIGYRRIPLKDAKGAVIPDASLFVQLDRQMKPDQNKKIKRLEKQLKATVAENDALKKRVDDLEKRFARMEAGGSPSSPSPSQKKLVKDKSVKEKS